MKLISTIIGPERLDAIKSALRARDVTELVVTEVTCHTANIDHTEIYKSAAYAIDSSPRLKLEAVVGDEMEDSVSDIFEAARDKEDSATRTLVTDVRYPRRSRPVVAPRAA